MKIVTLMDNLACPGLEAEHGLSLYIETRGLKILFDAGQSGAFAENAEKLGIDLKAVDLAVLSHGHYDHGGGLPRFLEINDHAKIYVNQYAFGRHCNAAGRYIGLDPALKDSGRLVLTRGEETIAPGLSLHTLPLPPEDSAGLTFETEGISRPEDFRHEQYLLVREGDRRVLLSGCSHKGIGSIMAHFRPDVLVGGFHFMKLEDPAALEAAARRLLAFDARYYTGHCTGQRQFALLKRVMGQRLEYLMAGREIEIDN